MGKGSTKSKSNVSIANAREYLDTPDEHVISIIQISCGSSDDDGRVGGDGGGGDNNDDCGNDNSISSSCSSNIFTNDDVMRLYFQNKPLLLAFCSVFFFSHSTPYTHMCTICIDLKNQVQSSVRSFVCSFVYSFVGSLASRFNFALVHTQTETYRHTFTCVFMGFNSGLGSDKNAWYRHWLNGVCVCVFCAIVMIICHLIQLI